jgi:hypothetical protein
MANDNDAFAMGYAFGSDFYRNGKTREDLPQNHGQEIHDRFGSSEGQWWAGFDRAAWWMTGTISSLTI